jgi:hypothetical protein
MLPVGCVTGSSLPVATRSFPVLLLMVLLSAIRVDGAVAGTGFHKVKCVRLYL